MQQSEAPRSWCCLSAPEELLRARASSFMSLDVESCVEGAWLRVGERMVANVSTCRLGRLLVRSFLGRSRSVFTRALAGGVSPEPMTNAALWCCCSLCPIPWEGDLWEGF